MDGKPMKKMWMVLTTAILSVVLFGCPPKTSETASTTTGTEGEIVIGEYGSMTGGQATFGVSDGTCLWAVRYASGGSARSLFASADVDAVKQLYPDNARLQRLSEGDHLIVSEPFSDLPGLWHEIPEATAVSVRHGGTLEQRPFVPRVDASAPAAAR